MLTPNYRSRKQLRLKGYDYSKAGLYFITICVQSRTCLFGKIADGKMLLNDAGLMIEKWYYELENKYPDKHCHEMVVMPNHFHCIIENDPKNDDNTQPLADHAGSTLRGRPMVGETEYGINNIKFNASIPNAMDWFKTMTTNEYIRGVKQWGWEPFDKKLWQRNYYEHIIRNDTSYQLISQYILENPAKWQEDKFNI